MLIAYMQLKLNKSAHGRTIGAAIMSGRAHRTSDMSAVIINTFLTGKNIILFQKNKLRIVDCVTMQSKASG